LTAATHGKGLELGHLEDAMYNLFAKVVACPQKKKNAGRQK